MPNHKPHPSIPTPLLSARHSADATAEALAFLALTEPHVFETTLDPVAGLAGDECRARRIAKQMGVKIETLRAPDALRAEGVASVGVYPQCVLERTFPINP